MRRLILLRHAKSDRRHHSGPDHERPLAPRGVRAARAMGEALARMGQVPDHAATSSAVRARATLELAIDAGGWEVEPLVDEDLYFATSGDTLEIIRALPAGAERALLVGHEPTWSTLAAILTGGSAFAMVTGAALAVDFPSGPWAVAAPGTGMVAWMLAPRLVTADDD